MYFIENNSLIISLTMFDCSVVSPSTISQMLLMLEVC